MPQTAEADSEGMPRSKRKISLGIIPILFIIIAVLLLAIFLKYRTAAFYPPAQMAPSETAGTYQQQPPAGAGEGESEGPEQDDAVREKKFQIVVDDLSWTEAEKAAREAGGRLLRIESGRDWEQVLELLDVPEYRRVYFWIGLHREDPDRAYAWIPENNKEERSAVYHDELSLWADGEPSYSYDGRAEDCGSLQYDEEAGTWELNDAADDLLRYLPSYTGRIGYIIEFEAGGENEDPVTEQPDAAGLAARAYLQKIQEYPRLEAVSGIEPQNGVFASLVNCAETWEDPYGRPYLVWFQGERQHVKRIEEKNTLLFALSVDMNHNDIPELITAECCTGDEAMLQIGYWGFDGNEICLLNDDYALYGIRAETDDYGFDKLLLITGRDQDYIHFTSYYDYMEYGKSDFFTNVSGSQSYAEYREYDWDEDAEPGAIARREYEVNGKAASEEEFQHAVTAGPKGNETMLAKTWGDGNGAWDQTWDTFNPTDYPEGHVSVYPVSLCIDPFRETEKTLSYLQSLAERE